MNEGIELHDSKLAAVCLSGDQVVVSFSSAYIHRSTGTPGVDAGSGWSQPATITLSGVYSSHMPSSLPAKVSDGFLRIGAQFYGNGIPASGSFADAIEFSVVLDTAELLTIRGEHVNIHLLGEPLFVESFEP